MVSHGRTSGGQFALGNPGGPGRPPRRSEKAYLDALLGRVTLEDWGVIVARAVADAKAGDRHARAWLTGFVVGGTDAEALAARIAELEGRLRAG